MKYIDCHSHWSDPRLFERPEWREWLQSAIAQQIDFFLLGGQEPLEWKNQVILKNQYPENFGLCFGLHPYFVSQHSFEECESALDELAQRLPQAMALGEAGLDFRPHIMKDSAAQQIEMFENQIEIAKAFAKPMVLHLVQAHEKALQVFNLWDPPDRGGFVHAFTGSYETARSYIDRGFLISVGGAVTYDKNKKLHDCVKKIPLEALLLESDAPDQPPLAWSDEVNHSQSILNVARAIAQIRELSPIDILEISASNFKRLFRC